MMWKEHFKNTFPFVIQLVLFFIVELYITVLLYSGVQNGVIRFNLAHQPKKFKKTREIFLSIAAQQANKSVNSGNLGSKYCFFASAAQYSRCLLLAPNSPLRLRFDPLRGKNWALLL